MNKEYWEKRVAYYTRKYGKDSVEVKSARLNMAAATAKTEKGEP